ncbi:MAG: Asp-tRNA(Asn)/Glu-tRNA(Gln) amidotransferase subunit GatA [Holosporales bacterium]|jgi:aspartyl-tRNA(Asn)/glutamyl-tRNA(Gln) amidotransferase subunit A|nr:Asp-tRNA(Asn)/Glu-tRNA(Gln) amidotransferase subunit GatA [Holosporales bacterium]
MEDNLTISRARAGLKNGDFSSVELTSYYLSRIDEGAGLNAYITVEPDKAISAAQSADIRIAKGEDLALLGIPLAIKDLFCTKGTRTTSGSKMLHNFIPQYESTVTQNLLDDGAIFLGKTNMDEFAMGSTNITSYFGPCFLPFRKRSAPDSRLVPGGSSGGSATAVASDLCIAATGSDTGGSVRQPASLSGLVGVKPTYGLCSRWGMIAFGSSLDQAGPLTKNVEDAAILLGSMAGYDPKDSTSENLSILDYTTFLDKPINGLRIGIVKEFMEGLSSENIQLIEKVCGWLRGSGCEVCDLSLKTIPFALPAYYIIAPAEASSNLARFDGVRYGYRADDCQSIDDLFVRSRSEGFGEEVKRRILTGTYVLSAGYYDAYYLRALKVRKMIMDDFQQNAFSKVDLILTMTTPTPAFSIEESHNMTPVEMYLNDVFTVTANITGLPAISVPVALSDDGLPLGIQLIGNKFQEGQIFSVSSAIEKCADFETLRKSILYSSTKRIGGRSIAAQAPSCTERIAQAEHRGDEPANFLGVSMTDGGSM